MNFKNDWTNTDEVQAQKDVYKGIEFRSKLESKTAQALDNIGIAWEYEPDGYKLTNGMWYRPDFWLPDARQFVECKGVMDEKDSAKIFGLVEDVSLPVVVLSYTNAMMVMRFFDNPDHEIVAYSGDEVGLAWCTECGKARFFAWPDTYKCPCCGAHDGDHYMRPAFSIGSATELFNYGQSLAADKPIYKQIANNFNN